MSKYQFGFQDGRHPKSIFSIVPQRGKIDIYVFAPTCLGSRKRLVDS